MFCRITEESLRYLYHLFRTASLHENKISIQNSFQRDETIKGEGVVPGRHIDTILSSGDDLYACLQPILPLNTIYLDPEELPTEIRVANYLAYIQSLSDNSWLSNGLFASSSGNKDVSFSSLVRNLDSIFNSITFNDATDSVIFTGQYYAVSFWRHNNFYFLFNSHAVNSSNQFLDQDELNVARLFRCHNLTSLASLLFARNIFDGSQYSMHKLY